MNLNEFLVLDVADQQQYFGKTFFQVTNDDKSTIWGWCPGFIHSNLAKFQIEPGGPLNSVNLERHPPNFDFPESGLYNLGNSTVYFHRVPKRQTKKGLCLETGQFRYFSNTILDEKGNILISSKGPEAWRIRGIKEMFAEPKIYTLQEAFFMFKKKKLVSFALDRDFAISLGVKSKSPSLWYKQVLVGEVQSLQLINLFPSLFQQEALDKFLPENVTIDGVI